MREDSCSMSEMNHPGTDSTQEGGHDANEDVLLL